MSFLVDRKNLRVLWFGAEEAVVRMEEVEEEASGWDLHVKGVVSDARRRCGMLTDPNVKYLNRRHLKPRPRSTAQLRAILRDTWKLVCSEFRSHWRYVQV